MNRSQAVVISVLIGLVTVTFIGLALVVFFPVDRFFAPLRTPTLTPSPQATPTPTFPNFMPTPGAVTATPGEPTPTGTRVPTSTLAPTLPPPSTVEFSFTPYIRPTPTSTPRPPLPPDTVTPAPAGSPTPNVRLYRTEFKVESPVIKKGACTDLVWHVDGPVSVTLGGESVELSGRKKVCPKRDTSYDFTTQISGNLQINRHVVRITVESGN